MIHATCQRFFLSTFTSSRLRDSGVNKVGVPTTNDDATADADASMDGRRDERGAHTRRRRDDPALRVLFSVSEGRDGQTERRTDVR